MRNRIIIGNWKMNKTPKEAVTFVKEFYKLAGKTRKQGTIIGFGVPYLCLQPLAKFNDNLVIAAQNCHYKDSGAYTGEVSVEMLNSIGITDCIVGHSERRTYYNETSKECNLKLKKLVEKQMYSIYCVGETLQEFEENRGKEVVKQQILEGLEGIEDLSTITIAYEPVWSIGTGKSASVEIAQDMCHFIRETIKELNSSMADRILIQYGGSVKAENVKSYMDQKDIDGVLVGGASLDEKSFKELIKNSME